MSFTLVSFYKFVNISDLDKKQASLLKLCQDFKLKGTIILAPEGVNATIVGQKFSVDKVINYLENNLCLGELEVKTCEVESIPFQRMKVKIKTEIITFGVSQANPHKQVGTYVTPQEWNKIISDPEVTVVDTRNEYEFKIGTFKRAQNPHLDSFNQFPDYIQHNLKPEKNQKIAMFCTGGIRCEKATSLLLKEGFEQVYHLKGGILKYLEEVPLEESLWEGECFVFDERVAVKHGLAPGSYQLCPNCGDPIPLNSQHSCQA
jgi:UPF0176 protein